jgi:ribosomal 50S subunit-associated protein YjgA (DUF615 family)
VNPPAGRRVSEFDRLFGVAYQSIIETVIESAEHWGPAGSDPALVRLLESLSRPFLALWIEHSQSLRLSALEGITSDAEWKALREFIRRYGHDLFTAKFMTLANLRGILHRGVGEYLDYLVQNPDPLQPIRLLDDLDRKIPRARAVHRLQIIQQAIAENYEIYKDYKNATPQADYGENLHTLLDFLRLKSSYDRHAWYYRPLALCHEILARRGRNVAAVLWQEAFARLTQERAQQHLNELHRLERTHGMVLRTVADRLEERFVQLLTLDRLCALIEPATEEARVDKPSESFRRFLQELEPFVSNPRGVGLDVPPWIRRLETEIFRIRTSRSAVAGLAEELFKLPRLTLPLEELQRQLHEWQQPPKPDRE